MVHVLHCLTLYSLAVFLVLFLLFSDNTIPHGTFATSFFLVDVNFILFFRFYFISFYFILTAVSFPLHLHSFSLQPMCHITSLTGLPKSWGSGCKVKNAEI